MRRMATEQEVHPYTVTEQNFTIQLVQPIAEQRHAIFFSHARETLAYQYERNFDDPGITHSLLLAVDGFGNVLKSASIAYGRRSPDLTSYPKIRLNKLKF